MNSPASWAGRLAKLLAELSRRGEFVKSAASQLEAPVVRAIRQELSSVGEPDPDVMHQPTPLGVP
jgi:hypothetical protein